MENTIAGVLLGAFISWIAYAVKIRNEKRQVLNRALFSILRVWKSLMFPILISSIDFEKIVNEIIDERFPSEDVESNMDISSMKEKAFHDEIISHFLDSDESALNLYQRAISDISSFNPILAFQLTSAQSLVKILKSYDDYFDEIKSNEKGEYDTLKFISYLEGHVNKEILAPFTSSIESIANKALSRTESKKVLVLLNSMNDEKVKRAVEGELRESFGNMIDQYIKDKAKGDATL